MFLMWEDHCVSLGDEENTFPRIAVLVSGSGTNLQAIIDDGIPVSLVVCDRGGIASIDRAHNAQIECVIVDRSDYKNEREKFTRKLVEVLHSYSIDVVVFAGFMSITTDTLINAYEERILNIHPSLLPSFSGTYGKGTMKATLEAGVKLTGVTIHIVTPEVDAGPILAQEAVEVLEGDDENILHARIQKVEHRLYPQVIRQFCLKVRTYLTDNTDIKDI